MSELVRLQREFASAILGHPKPTLSPAWASQQRSAAGLAAYRVSVFGNLAAALESAYPVIRRIVGDEFFSATANAYIRCEASACGDLNRYGDRFSQFLSHYEPALTLPYLPDMATLEWQIQAVYGVADAPRQDLAPLANSAPDEWGTWRLILDPVHSILASRWPLQAIWMVNQPDYEGDFEIDFDQAQCVLVQRRAGGMGVEVISPAECAFLAALAQNETLDQAVGAALATRGEFDLTSVLSRFIENGLIRSVQ